MGLETARLTRFIEDEAAELLGILRYYVVRAGLAVGDELQGAAIELLGDVVVEALEHADRFDPLRSPRAWLLAIAANLIKRRQAERARQERRTSPVREHGDEDDGDMFDRIAALGATDPADGVEADEEVATILSLVPSSDDQHILRLALIHDLDGETIARELGVSPATARVRLHRAVRRLRAAWHAREQQEP